MLLYGCFNIDVPLCFSFVLYLCPDCYCIPVYRTIASSKDHSLILPACLMSHAFESNTCLHQRYNYLDPAPPRMFPENQTILVVYSVYSVGP